jgi:HNH endonuclease
MDAATRAFVRMRAGDRCEYCLLRQEHIDLPHHIEHIIAKQHSGDDSPDNAAFSCARCNLHKGPNLSGIDPETGELVPLFNPRRDEWAMHFAFRNYWIAGLTPVGRATVYVLGMNETRRLELRAMLLARGEPL